MSWTHQNYDINKEDWGRLLDFTSPAWSEAYSISSLQHPEEGPAYHDVNFGGRKTLEDQEIWEEWLGQDFSEAGDGFTSKINLVMAGKASYLAKLPFTKESFSQIMRRLHLHSSIIRAINRNTSCTFQFIPGFETPGHSMNKSMVYNCRTAAGWDGDMALSVTFFPETLTTNALWLGCDLTKHDIRGSQLTDAELLTRQLSKFDGGVFHPLLLPTLFADQERERHAKLVRTYTTQLVQRLSDLAYPDDEANHPATPGTRAAQGQVSTSNNISEMSSFQSIDRFLKPRFQSTNPTNTSPMPADKKGPSQPFSAPNDAKEPSAMLWLKFSDLKNGLENWQAQLLLMIEHVDMLQDLACHPHISSSMKLCENLVLLQEPGNRIKRRLQDLVSEYNEFIRECTHSLNGITLASQLELNNISREDSKINQRIAGINLEVAQLARRDGNLMKSIAVIGLIFLPGTFVSALFSTGLFKWIKEDEKRVVSPYIWVFVLVTVLLTLATFGLFHFILSKRFANEKRSSQV